MLKNVVAGIFAVLLSTGAAMAADTVQQATTSVPEQAATVAKSVAQNDIKTDVQEAESKKADMAVRVVTKELPTAPAPFTVKESAVDKTATEQTAPTVTIKTTTEKENKEAVQLKQSWEKKITLNLASRILTVYEGNIKTRLYHTGVGKVSTPTPTGYYEIQNKEINPTWINPENRDEQVSSGEDNPLGYRWLGFNGTYGMHGTNRPDSIGGYVSNGCVRLHEEDVEDLYNLIPVGTPVEIFYDRIVIDRDADHTISYYIYPDGYGRQPLDVGAVKKALAGYGVENFEGAEAIAQKIAASDGEPTYVAKAYDLVVKGKKLAMRALGKNDDIYLPAVAVASAIKSDLNWDAATGMLTSPYGQASGYVKSDVVYFKGSDTEALFPLRGTLTKDLIYEMEAVTRPIVTVTPTSTVSIIPNSPETPATQSASAK